ncbi:MAG: phage holin family protein [Bradymonadaceae bacterium]|nr:phage holin family protein [Lujinxingiaceae bacterium]
MAEIRVSEQRNSGINVAFQGLTDGLTSLIRNHLDLVRYEVKEEATTVGKNVAALALFGFIALVGFGLLNLTAILFAGWFGGIVAMAITALVLTLINLGGSLYAIRHILKRFEDDKPGLSQTSEEIQRDKQWIKQIRDNNSHVRLPAETS